MRRLLALVFGVYALMLATVLGIPLFVLLLCLLPLPRWTRSKVGIRLAAAWSWLVQRVVLLARVEVSGQWRLPPGQGALIICNHRSWLDPLLVIQQCLGQGLSKREILYLPVIGLGGWITGAIFFDRRSQQARRHARDEVLEALRTGNRLHVFPEGTRSRDGELREKVYLTLMRDCFDEGYPVVPTAVLHTERVILVDTPGATPLQRCSMAIGEPLLPGDYPDRERYAVACWEAVAALFEELRAEEGARSGARTRTP